MDDVEFRQNFGLSCSRSFSRHLSARLSAVKVWDLKTEHAQQSFTASASRGQRFSVFILTLSRPKVSRGLDKPNTKLLGQDKPRLDLAVGWISGERRFCTAYFLSYKRPYCMLLSLSLGVKRKHYFVSPGDIFLVNKILLKILLNPGLT